MDERTVLVRALSATEKCFDDEKITDKTERTHFTALRGQKLCFQLAYAKMTADLDAETPAKLVITSPIADAVRLESIEPVPVYKPCYPDVDDYYLRKEPGFYPDLLMPVEGPWHRIFYSRLRAFFVTVDCGALRAGEYDVTFDFTYEDEKIGGTTVTVKVLDAVLEEQKLFYTNWFHADCLASYYGVGIYSEKHWELIEAYLAEAVAEGINMILTPVLTPPLDTGRGWNRPDVGLVDITKTADGYTYNYAKLDRWIALCDKVGVKRFEISHLFCQWSAARAPQVTAYVDGVKQRIFGWETEATSPEYTAFIRSFVKSLIDHLKAIGADKKCFFHISDEPNMQVYDSYVAAKDTVIDLFEGYPVVDALSEHEFFRSGQIRMPIPATTEYEAFRDDDVPMKWTYYCCGQTNEVSNRMLAMPGERTEILGVQLYRYGIEGFLQWGYNFWYSASSWHTINPFVDLSGDNWVPAGDTFAVYPGPTGKPLRSLHGMLVSEALTDLRLLQTAEKKIGRDAVMALVLEGTDGEMTFRKYPHGAAYLEGLKEKIYKILEE